MRNKEIHLKKEWDDRQEILGNTPQAVLFKRFPGWLNGWIHRQHKNFILTHLPEKLKSFLDVGCGYGRISAHIQASRPGTRLEGVELCTPFAQEYERLWGPCFNGPIQEYQAPHEFDAIISVTLLMYLDREEIPEFWRNCGGPWFRAAA